MSVFSRLSAARRVARDEPPTQQRALPDMSLTRHAVVIEDAPNDIVGLAVNAEKMLGYSALRQRIKAPGPLARLLHDMDITVFDTAEVERYKSHCVSALRKRDFDAYWDSCVISKYNEPIPEFVLRKAVSIKEREPRVSFFVHHLRLNFKTVDPFLQVAMGIGGETEMFFIEVWDEPKFEAKL